MIEDLDVLPYLDTVLLSEDEGVEKPSREIFQRACQRLGIKPEETVHVGDELDWYVHTLNDTRCEHVPLIRDGAP